MTLVGAASVTLTDRDLLRLSAAPFDKAKKMGRREILGKHYQNTVLAEYICSDLCPAYTTRVIRYALPVDGTCESRGGTIDARWVPRGIAVAQENFCVPSVLARGPKGS